MKRMSLIVPTALMMIGLAGCGSPPPTKSSAAVQPITLNAVSYTTNTLAGDTLDRLVDEVSHVSNDAVTLTPGPGVYSGAQDGSAEVIRMVRDGTVDVGIVASRTFDLEGSTSLQALNAPLVVEDPTQAAAFLADDVTGAMLSGLSDAGVVGLALVPDQLRQPLGYDGPLLDPDSLRGTRILARPSRASEQVLTALGATADPRNGDDAEAAISAGEVQGAETSMDRPSGFQSGAEGHTSAITANVQLSIKANVIIVNPKVWSGLTTGQQSALRAASTATRTWASTQVVTLADAAQRFCDLHIGDVVVADENQLAAWGQAVAPAVAALEAEDPVTKAAIARMREMVANAPSTDLAEPCAMVPSGQLASVEPIGDQGVVEGDWRLLVSAQNLSQAGATAQDAAVNAGTWTFTFRGDGTFEYVEPHNRACPGTFSVAGDRLSMTEDSSVGDCDGQWELTFARQDDRVTFVATPDYEALWPPIVGFLANPLQRIGDATP